MRLWQDCCCYAQQVTQGLVLPGMPGPEVEREDFDYLLLTAPSQAQTPAAPWGGESMTPPYRPDQRQAWCTLDVNPRAWRWVSTASSLDFCQLQK